MLDLDTILQAFEKAVIAYHSRDGTRNFHYRKFEITSLNWLDTLQYPFSSLKVLDDEEGYVVIIWYADNSNSWDCYAERLTTILKWYNEESIKN
jgi:hypothetical protein